MVYFPFYVGDFKADTTGLDMCEQGVYVALLLLLYDTERPLNPNIPALCKMIGARKKSEVDAVTSVLGLFFDLTENGYVQKRAMLEIEKYQAKAERARINGKNSGGRPRKKTESVSDADAGKGFAGSEDAHFNGRAPSQEKPSGFATGGAA